MKSAWPLFGRVRAARAFTLIELLTVIAIIGILAAIIIPVTGRVRDHARTTQCVSNLRQIAMANLIYANDNKGQLVVRLAALRNSGDPTSFIMPDSVRSEGNWQKAIARYMGMDKTSARSRFICPAAGMTEAQMNSGNESSYNVSRFLEAGPAYGRIQSMQRPVVMVADIFVSNESQNYPWNVSSGNFGDSAKRKEMFRHNGNNRRNVALTDASARSLSPSQDGVFRDGSAIAPNLWLQPGAGTSASLTPSASTDVIP